MAWRLLADAVLLLHLGFVIFVAAGALAVHWRPRLAWLHLPALAWGVGIEFAGGVCPLTPLENRLRILGGAAGYHGGFVEHYLLALIYPDGLTRAIQVGLGATLLVANLVAYGLLARQRRLPWQRRR